MSLMLKTENVCKNFAGLKALNNISIEVEAGEIYGIIGPNGAGKTTLFNAISGFSKPSSGKVFFNGTDMTDRDTTYYANHGLARTFQNIRVFSKMTVLENVAVGMHDNIKSNLFEIIFRTSKQRNTEDMAFKKCMDILNYLGIGKYANLGVGSLPYGTQRLVEIARALASNPKLLLLDEPTAGMNEQETIELMKLIKKINVDYGTTLIIIEHNVKFIMTLCKKVAVLNFGELLLIGLPEEVQNDPRVIEAYIGDEEEDNVTNS